jgi:hypothetical protein
LFILFLEREWNFFNKNALELRITGNKLFLWNDLADTAMLVQVENDKQSPYEPHSYE